MENNNDFDLISVAKMCLVAAIAYWALGPIGLALYALYKLCRISKSN